MRECGASYSLPCIQCSTSLLGWLCYAVQYSTGETALHAAVSMMPKTIFRLVKLLLKHRPDAARAVSDANYLPLHQAVMGVASPAVLQV